MRINLTVASFFILLLTISIGVQFFPEREARGSLRFESLAAFLPQEIHGWTISDEKMGTTEAQEDTVRSVLRYDDAIYRVYSKGSVSVGILIVHWWPENRGADRAHVPDICFPGAGWTPVAQEHEKIYEAGAYESQPGQYREFKSSSTIEVVYWHLRCGELSGSFMGGQERWGVRLPYKINQFKKSFPGGVLADETFVRVTSTTPLGKIFQEADLQPLFAALAKTGAFKLKND